MTEELIEEAKSDVKHEQSLPSEESADLITVRPNAFALKAHAKAIEQHGHMLNSNAWYQKKYKDATSPPPPRLPRKPSRFTLLREPSMQLLHRYGVPEDADWCCCIIQ